jgi:hypothetical protein
MHTTVEQNKAHRADLNWIRVGKSEHMNANGTTIKKDCNTNLWFITDIDGNDLKYCGRVFGHHSLTSAKHHAERFGA